jgi:hypothetical protein
LEISQPWLPMMVTAGSGDGGAYEWAAEG